MKSSRRRRWLIALTCALLTVGTIPFAWHYWYFREVEHHRVVSPDGQWAIVVTKQMQHFLGEAEVRWKIIQNSEPEVVLLAETVDRIDVWADAKPESYRIEWVSPTEFRIGGRHPEEGFESRWKFDGQKWIGRPDGWD